MDTISKIYKPPVLLIKNVTPSLEKAGQVYAYHVIAEAENGSKCDFRERRGMQMQAYIGSVAECILEVLDADFFHPRSKEEIKQLPKDILYGEYVWSNTGYKFIPELFEMIEGDDNDDYDYDEDEYDRIAEDYFNNWGIEGLGLGVYQDKPMVKTEQGVFLFNEYQNEEDVEKWEVGQTIYFRPKEILLRGLKVVKKENWKNAKKKEITTGPNEMLIHGGWSVLDPF